MCKNVLTLLIFFLPCHAFSQHDFYKVDSVARSIKYDNDIYKLTKDLTNPYEEQVFKVRSIFIWITDNIKYDYEFINKEKELKYPECATEAGCAQMMREWELNYLKKVLKNKKAICDGYSRLFQKMCEIAGIRSEIIAGYTKTKPYQVGLAGFVNHAWNAVLLDSTYYFLDPTWAGGYCVENEETGKLVRFEKKYMDYYWFTPWNDLARNHYPKEGKWVFEPNYTKEKYADNPYYATDVISKIHVTSPQSGVINAKKGDTIHFKFNYTGVIRYLQVNTNIFRNPSMYVYEQVSKRKKAWVKNPDAPKRQQYIDFKINGEQYEFDYIVPDNSLYYIDVLFDFERVMRFKVKTG